MTRWWPLPSLSPPTERTMVRSGWQLEGSARLDLAHREEARGVDSVGNDADLLTRHPQPDRGALERVADRHDPVRRPQGPAELGTVGGIAGEPDDAAAKRDDHRAPEDPREQDPGHPVGVVELRVDDVERKPAPQPDEKGHERRGVEQPVETLQVPGDAEDARVVDRRQAGLRLQRGDAAPPRPADQPIEREPRHGRHHHDVTAARHAPDALANEDPEDRLLRVREHRAENQDPGAHRRHRGWGARGPDGSSP